MTVLETTNSPDDNETPGLPATQSTSGAAPAERSGLDHAEHATVELDATSVADHGSRRRLIVAIVVLAGLAAVAAWFILGDDDAEMDLTNEPVTIQAVVAEQRDLIEYTDLDGTLGYASTVTVNAQAPGVITDAVDEGVSLVRGDRAVEVDAEPVVVFYGDQPFYRTMQEGIEGDDVRILEQNLASLGYHATEDDGEQVDEGFTVDGVFDAETTAAVNRWQEDLGVDETGVVLAGDAIVISGPAISVSPLEKGVQVQQGTVLLSMHVTGSEGSLYSVHAGELELVAASGVVVDGTVLYVADDLPITAVVVDPADDVAFDRDLFDGVADGDDVREVEEMLMALGYDARGDLEVDDEFDEYTAEAIEEWQEDLQDEWSDVVVDGTFRVSTVMILEPETALEGAAFADREYRANGAEIYATTSSSFARIVATSIEVADQGSLVEGMDVTVEFPDGQTVDGVVSTVASSSTRDLTDPTSEPEFAVEITLASVPESAERFSELDVEVKIVDRLAEGVTVVPASALVATNDGYAVEVVEGSTTQFVAVEPGMFADGFVEVSGIAPGTAVVVPS